MERIDGNTCNKSCDYTRNQHRAPVTQTFLVYCIMATFLPLQRRPLVSRSLQGHSKLSPTKQLRTSSTSKRPRSPEPQTTQKRVRSATIKCTVPTTRDLSKEQRIAEREQKEEEFRRKYSRSFPLWTFYLDIDNIDPSLVQSFKSRLRHLGAVCL